MKKPEAAHPRPPVEWSQAGSNRRPPACKAGALPTELWPLGQRVVGNCAHPRTSPLLQSWQLMSKSSSPNRM